MNRERGVVALTTSILVSLLFMLTLLGLITVMLSEKRQSADADQSVRAYFAAEAGAERALLKIKNDLQSSGNVQAMTSCADPANPLNQKQVGPSNEVVTCVKVSTQRPELTHQLKQDGEAFQVDLGAVPATLNADFLQIEWNQTGDYPGPFADFSTTGFRRDPITKQWKNAAVLELSNFSYNNGVGGLNSSSVAFHQTMIAPTSEIIIGTHNEATGPRPAKATCDPARPEYKCSIRINMAQGGGSRSRIIRLRARYADTHFRLKLYKSNGDQITELPDSSARIDVTARAGSVYRRLIQYVPITNGVARGLDYVIYSETDICKGVRVLAGTTDDSCPL